MREVIAAAMARSKREIPHYYLSLLVDYSAARAWLDTHNASVPITARMLPVVPLIKAIALAAQQSEGFNGYYIDGAYTANPAVHLGVAIAQRGGGLVTPAILDAHNKSLDELMQALSDLVSRTRSGHLKSSELSAGTLTLTSLGEESVDSVMPIIYPPQVAIIGAGTIEPRPWAVDGRIESRFTVQLSLAADHRVSDGRTGARFLRRIRDLLQTPETL
jgi:pyruvate dehydrogenase E2 component (dihydrolipoamide acetyltransferase)